MFRSVLLLAMLWASAAAAVAQPAPASRVPAELRAAVAHGASIRVIVRVREAYRAEGRLDRSAALAQRARLRDRLGRVVSRLPNRAVARRFRLIPYFAAEVDAGALAQLESDPEVQGIEEDKRLRPALAESGSLVGASSAWALGYTGAGWTIAVLDTGIDATHPFLAGKVVSEACYSNAGGTAGGISLCPGGAVSSTAAGSARHCDIGGCDHGTHVAGIAAGLGSNVSGIARDARLISMQVFTRFNTSADCGFQSPCLLSYTSDIILALERVFALKDTHRVAAVNLSLGEGRYFSQASCDADNLALKAAIDQLRSVGIAAIAASGNDGYFNSMSAPACISSAVSVGSSSKSDQVSGFTNAAPFLHLLAPGSLITSSLPGGGVDVKSGTSMAAPHVAGAWALLKQRRPSATVPQILSALRTTGVGVTDPLTGFVFPRIRVAAAATALSLTQMIVESPPGGQTLALPFTVSGWALDASSEIGTGVDAVHVWAYPSSGPPIFAGAAGYGTARPDVAALFGARFSGSGFSLPVASLAPGAYQLIAYAHSSVSGAFDATQVMAITIAGRVSDPQSVIETPLAGAIVTPTFTVAGWAIDRASVSGAGVDAVHVYAYPNTGVGAAPIFLGVASYGAARGDVGALFGSSFTHSGFSLAVANLAPGPYRIVVYSHSTMSGLFAARTRDITVRALGDPLMNIDTPVSGATVGSAFLVAGWAIDRDAGSDPGIDAVHVWAYPANGSAPRFLGTAAYGGTRGDVAAAFGARFANAGYSLVATGLAPGSYDVVVYPHSAVSGSFAGAKIVRVEVTLWSP